MGITFRSGDYIRFVYFGGRTIKDGEAASVWNRRGEHTQIIGPKRIFLWCSTIRFLTRYKAEYGHYLRVTHKNGTVQHIRGPQAMYLNPKDHDNITVNDGFRIKENEVIQVCHMPMFYNDDYEIKDLSYKVDGTLVEKSKRLVFGPTLCIPEEDELVEQFEWICLPSEIRPESTLVYGTDKFSVIKLHKNDTWKVQVSIGNNPSRVYASLAITYKIDSIDKLTSYHDPHASLCTALMANIQELFQDTTLKYSTSGFQDIQADATDKLTDRESFHQFLGSAKAFGFCIEAVKLLEVSPGDEVRLEMKQEHDHTMMMKARVAKKESEIALQELELEESRKKMENKIELIRKEAMMEADLAEETYIQKVKALDQECKLERKKELRQLEAWKVSDESVLNFLGNLKDLGVDMSLFMCTPDGKKVASEILKRAPSLASSRKAGNEDD
jgi:hypothetical protein